MQQYHYDLIATLQSELEKTRPIMESKGSTLLRDALRRATAEVLRDAPVPASCLSVGELDLGINPHHLHAGE